MDLLPDPDQEQIAREVADLLERQSPPGRLRQLPAGEAVADPKVWQLAAEQGWFGLGLPEEAGGAGLGLAEQTLVFRELGRQLTAGPFLGTTLAAHVVHAAGDEATTEGIVSGDLPVGLCERVADREGVRARVRTFDADDAALFLVVDRESASLLHPNAIEVVGRRPCIDVASRWADLDVTGDALHTVPAARFDAFGHGQVLVAATLSGIAAATRDASASYAKLRKQFDVAIGSFQAVKHRCAEQAVRAEAAAQIVTLAALALDADRPDAALLGASARLVAADSAVTNASDNIQNHGGIGYTYEHDAHLYLKRAHVLALTLGDPRSLHEAILAAPPARPH
jgi:alkylation response protein AidB-like acyl-CoA dehydrogenase